jgi:anti-sigma factor RsiW
MECQTCCELLTALLDEELSPEERRVVEGHLKECGHCEEELKSLAYAFQMTERVLTERLDAPNWGRIESKLPGSSSVKPNPFWAWVWRPVAVAAAVLVILAGPVDWLWESESEILERQFQEFVAQEVEEEAIHRRLLATSGVAYRNPYSVPDVNRNPYSTE